MLARPVLLTMTPPGDFRRAWFGTDAVVLVRSMNLHHFFQFRDGKIAYYRGTEDSALTAATFQD